MPSATVVKESSSGFTVPRHLEKEEEKEKEEEEEWKFLFFKTSDV